jgi:hypothetical protein
LSVVLAKVMTSTLELLTLVLISRHGGEKGRGGREAMAFPDRVPTPVRRRGVPRQNRDESLVQLAYAVQPSRLSVAVVEQDVPLVALRDATTDRSEFSECASDPARG